MAQYQKQIEDIIEPRLARMPEISRVNMNCERPIYLGDIASVEDTVTDCHSMTLRNGKSAYYITISRANDAITVAALDEIKHPI